MLLITTHIAFAQYQGWITGQEPWPPNGDSLWSPYATGDTFVCSVHSNDQMAIFGSPVFYDMVRTHASSFWQGPGYNPEFHLPPVFGAPIVPVPGVAESLRQFATNYYSPGNDKQMRIRIIGAQADVWIWDLGEAFDSLTAQHEQIPLGGGDKCIFTETPLELFGFDIQGSVTVGSAQVVRLMNDVRVGGPSSGSPEYRVLPGNTNYVGIVSEGDIKIANTPANGRENSNGLGFDQMNPALTDIVINAAVVAAGSFTFEQQNDPDSGYVCDCAPDWRGQIYLYGSVIQGTRGFLSRANNDGTGYRLMMRYDSRFLRRRPPCFYDPGDSTRITTDTLSFGDVVIGQTVTDTAHIYVSQYSTLGMATATPPYVADPTLPAFGTHFIIPVHFTPPYVGSFNGLLQVTTTYDYFEIPLRGRGVVPNSADSAFIVHPSSFIVSVSPNPFNSTAVLTFELPSPEHVTIDLLDILGRRALTLMDENVLPGVHSVPLNASALSSGLYFAHIRTPSQQQTLKLMLVK